MPEHGWKRLVAGWPWFRGTGKFPRRPNSEFMPPLYVIRKPYGTWDPMPYDETDPWGWPVPVYDEAQTLRPGLHDVALSLLGQLVELGSGGDSHGLADYKLRDNLYWPRGLAKHAGKLKHERFVLLLPLALSLTIDDKARVRWTLYGGSEQGPARAFWRGFFTAPTAEWPRAEALEFFRRLLHGAYGEPATAEGLRDAGFRILPLGKDTALPFAGDGPMPSWTEPLLWSEDEPLAGVKYLLTFRPWGELPLGVRRGYLAGRMHLLPFPGSLLFWGSPGYFKLAEHFPCALHIPLLHSLDRKSGISGLRVPQAGWMAEGTTPRAHGPIRNTFRRGNRHDRIPRSQDNVVKSRAHKLTHVLFSTRPEDVELYTKPMARNVQLWTREFEPVLDGPRADPDDIHRALRAVVDGGLFGYRFLTPAMRVGKHEVYWQRTAAAYVSPGGRHTALYDGPPGWFTAYRAERPDLKHPVEMWPRLQRHDLHALNAALFLKDPRTKDTEDEEPNVTLFNVRKLIQSWEMLGRRPLPRSFARQLLTVEKNQSLDGWLRSLPAEANDAEQARLFVAGLRQLIEPDEPKELPPALTYERTASREFEAAYWDAIATLSTGSFVNKNNADCVLDQETQRVLRHPWRDLEPMGDYLLARHSQSIADAGMGGKALLGELPFCWKTDFDFSWMGGWEKNQQGKERERNLLMVIPGRDRGRAVVLADHYDTAYMHDRYEEGDGARLAAAGADDNCSATATLLLAAPIYLRMSREGRLGCDVWLLHLTGEEYPAEGLGTDRMCEWLVEGTLKLRLPGGKRHDLSKVQIKGIYVMDMIAHNSKIGRYVFQISPGASRESLWLAYQAHVANLIWNASAPLWNELRPAAGPGRRSPDGRSLPELALHPQMDGEIRPPYDPCSSLYNTDGQDYSDVGVPVTLLMENYDIGRVGYHDTHDTLDNIDLDYGAALAAIAIESAARAACIDPPPDSPVA